VEIGIRKSMSDTSFIEAARTIKKLASSEFSELVEVEDEKFELHFDYLGWPLIARITPHESGSLHMQLLGKVGRLSFAAEGRERRIGAIVLLRSTAKRQPINQVRFDPQWRHRASLRPRTCGPGHSDEANSRDHNPIG